MEQVQMRGWTTAPVLPRRQSIDPIENLFQAGVLPARSIPKIRSLAVCRGRNISLASATQALLDACKTKDGVVNFKMLS
jgi:hypothetical protein